MMADNKIVDETVGRTRVKICGLFREEDIRFVNEALPDYIGFVFAESRRKVTSFQATLLKAKLHPDIRSVGVFVNAGQKEIISLVGGGVIDMVQLHGDEDPIYIQSLRRTIKAPLVKALAPDKFHLCSDYENAGVDYFLFDSGRGGTGQVFTWEEIPHTKLPYFLAGGLNGENLEDAIRTVRPFAIDLSSGVETEGVKDREKILDVIGKAVAAGNTGNAGAAGEAGVAEMAGMTERRVGK